MQVQQLITILCLCLSQALAAPLDMFESQMNAIVVDLTEHRVPKDAVGTKLNDALHSDFHEPAAAKNTQKFYDAIDPLLEVDEKNTRIFMDIRAAHEDTMRDNFGVNPEVRADRLREYQDAMYSRLRDIVQGGDAQPVAAALGTFHQYAKSLIKKHFPEWSPSTPVESFEYRTTEETNEALAKTNLPGTNIPDARRIDGTNSDSFGNFVVSHAAEQYKQRFGPAPKAA
ncbi:hypothetical protein KEM48_001670 [Puccinia striiformis f. sp. tritici PST-130]|nr:hypothetical protein Pst134EB_001897 [Puccinia striiformis f. sp. tritici]KAI9606979.1 hypothetical protein KEM48_001670 [Puccinia striiformis f. sp. tritici PST-130]